MSTLSGTLKYIIVMFMISSRPIFSNEVPASSHFESCPGKVYKTKCYQLGERGISQRYLGSCDVVTIHSEEENNFVKDLMNEANESSAWMRKPYFGYSNFDGWSTGRCYYIKSNGRWEASYQCETLRRPVCSSELVCQEGWIGRFCDRRCHCYNDDCSRYFSRCFYGCEPGRIGFDCSEEVKAPKIEYYCFKSRTHYSMRLSMEWSSSYPQNLVPLDSKGRPINPENYTKYYNGSFFVLEISTNDLSSPFVPVYHESKIHDNTGTTFEWFFRLCLQSNVRVQTDYDFKVKCNFSESDLLYDSTSVTFDGSSLEPQESNSTPSASNFHVEMFMSDSKNSQPLKSITIGQPVKVVMTQQFTSAAIGPVFLSPRECLARSFDDQVVMQLSDADGCTMLDSVFGKFLWKGDTLESTIFAAFALPGYSSMNISCSLVVCSNVSDEDCIRPCKASYYRRRRRSIADTTDPVLMEVMTSVEIR